MEIFLIILVLILAAIANYLQSKEADRWCKTDAYFQLCEDLGITIDENIESKKTNETLFFEHYGFRFRFSVSGVMGGGLAFSKVIGIGLNIPKNKQFGNDIKLETYNCHFKNGTAGRNYAFVFTPPTAESIFKDIDDFMLKYEEYVGEPLQNVSPTKTKK